MKKSVIIKVLLFVGLLFGWQLKDANCQNALNNKGDNIVGTYAGKQGEDRFRVKISKLSDGTYRGQVVWLERDRDADGKKILDSKNPDKSLRTRPADQTVLFSGLKYNEKKRRWDDTKIYDPQRGIRANMTAEFTSDGQLKIRGSLMGIGESVVWQKVK